MSLIRLTILLALLLTTHAATAQVDTTINSLESIPGKYIKTVDAKIARYSHRLSSKTEKTLTKLSRWENKIKGLLQKASPETAERLFAIGRPTFTTLLQKLQQGRSIAEGYTARYNAYVDKLTTNIKYLQDQKAKIATQLVKPVGQAGKKMEGLQEEIDNSEALEQFIGQRKQELINESIKYIGKSKYLTRINKEAYYYVETIRNYKALFSDSKKAEETALNILNRIPAFKRFVQQNSMLASLFRLPGSGGSSNTPNLAGLQTTAQVNSLIQDRIASGGPNAQAQLREKLQQAQAELNKLKDRILKAGGNGAAAVPDFKPNNQKTKTFGQRLEFGSNVQFVRNNKLVPASLDVGLSLGYRLNDRSVMGVGASYKMGLGSIQHISISHQGIGIRSFVDWKLKKEFFVSGGFEMNHNAAFKNIEQLKDYSNWQQSGLIGMSKKMTVKTKYFKGAKLQLLYDLLHRQHIPVSQPVLFRIGYEFK